MSKRREEGIALEVPATELLRWPRIVVVALGGVLAAVHVQGAPQAGPPDVPPGPAPVVHAEEDLGERGLFLPGAPDAALPEPNHPPIDQIPSMPMADEAYEQRATASGSGSGVIFDPVTGVERVFPAALGVSTGAAAAGGGYGGVDGGGGEGDLDRPATFSNMTLQSVGTRATHPWRMNVKLVMRFGSSYFVCSGTMRDPETVLTAGHCVFDFGGAGWADEIWVYPGWDGVGSVAPSPPSISNPYGWARGTFFGSWTGWTGSGDFNYDVGIIGVTRAVGALTGWFGWAHGGTCAFRTGQAWNNASYPAESCPQAGLHNGRDMYYWFGSFDSCPSFNRLQVDTTGGCFNAGWGGMSGSGAYYAESGNRYVHAITSTSDRATFTRYARQFEDWVNWNNDTFIPDVRGAVFDLQALDVNASPVTIPAGGTTTLLNHLATNPTNGAMSGNFVYRVYLSSNDNISSSDTLLSTQNYDWSFAPLGSVTVNMAQVTIPAGTAPGNYFIGVEYDPATDGETDNNGTDGWDAVAINVGQPDLDVTALNAPSTAEPGETVSVTSTVQNVGNATAGASSLGVYISSDLACTTDDDLRASRTIPELAAGASSSGTTSVLIPAGTSPGTSYVCAIADRLDQVVESNEGNNTGSDPVTVVQANLTMTVVDAPSPVSPGDVVSVANTVRNLGTAEAGGFRVGLYLSPDPVCSTSDVLVGSRVLASLGVFGSSAASTGVTIPPGTQAGTHYLCGIADDLEEEVESNEADNVRADPFDVIVPTVNLEVNGADVAYPGILDVVNPVHLTLDMTPGLESLDHYFGIVSNGTLYWVTPGGLSTTAAPLAAFTPAALSDVTLLQSDLTAGVWGFVWIMVDGGTIVGSDVILANVAP